MEVWQETFWMNPNTKNATGVSIIFKSKKGRDRFLKECQVVFQFENPNR